jgi:hypothetical protein
MLANLLPGIREIRTPLATGYIWLLTFWLWIPQHFKDVPPTTGVPGDIARIAHYSGRVGVAVALSFIAYLIGALSGIFNATLTRIGSYISWHGSFLARLNFLVPHGGDQVFVIRGQPFIYYIGRSPTIRVQLALLDFLRSDVVGREVDNPERWAKIALLNSRYHVQGIDWLAEYAERVMPTEPYLAYLIREVYKRGNALRGKEEELFATYDRLIAEYEFRIGITAPLIALIVTLAVSWTLFWLLALLPVLLLLKTGCERRMDAGDVLADAVRQERLLMPRPPGLDDSNQDDQREASDRELTTDEDNPNHAS